MSALALLALLAAVPALEDARALCQGRGIAIVVDTGPRVLWLCEADRAVEGFPVALGSGGVGKRIEGDAKVPLGEYPLGHSVPSERYRIFIPVGYPTRTQRRSGLTGGAIGVHGPARGYEGPLSTTVDWTLGCIAVGTDQEIRRVADWVKSRRASRIFIQ